LGFFYWILAARLFPVEVVGLNAAVLSASMFISSVAQLNLNDALIRFLPAAGRTTKKLLLSSYLISTLVILIVSVVFIFGIPVWSSQLNPLITNPVWGFGFVLFTVVYGIFALQDSALTGIRKAVWVPVENTIFAILKIALLFVFAGFALQFGVLASWLVPLILIVLIVNIFLWGSLIPKHRAATWATSEVVTVPRVARYVAGDYLGGLFWMGVTSLQTVVVAQLLGTAESAHFYLVWQVAYGLYMVSRMMGMSLVAEGVANRNRLDEYYSHALKQTTLLVLPAVALVFIVAPWVLSLYGQDYAVQGSALLRLLSLSAIPQIIIAMELSIARVKRRPKSLFVIQASESIVTFIFMGSLLLHFGITGLGWAWLLGQSIVALTLVFPRALKLLRKYTQLDNVIQMYHVLLTPWTKLTNWRWVARANAELLPNILANLHESIGLLPKNWYAKSVIPTVTDIKVFTLANEMGQVGLLKLANSERSVKSLQSQNITLDTLHKDPRLAKWHRLVPSLLTEGSSNGGYYVVEALLPGNDARSLLWKTDARQRMLAAASSVIAELHQCTMQVVQVDADLLHQWIDARISSIQQAGRYCTHSKVLDPHIECLRNELYQSLCGCSVPVGWIHGDYSPGNILVTDDGGKVEGVVDWGLAGIDLPQLDLIHLLISVRMYVTNRELGSIMIDLLDDEDWTQQEWALLQAEQQTISGQRIPMRTLLLLSWLRHVSSNLNKSVIYMKNWLWFDRNVEAVLRTI